MRDFKNVTYDGPECVCCKDIVREARESERQKMAELIQTELLWPQLDDGYRGGLQWMLRQLTDSEANGV